MAMVNDDPIVDVVAHPTRYMLRCSRCGIVAVELTPAEADEVRSHHRCPKGYTVDDSPETIAANHAALED